MHLSSPHSLLYTRERYLDSRDARLERERERERLLHRRLAGERDRQEPLEIFFFFKLERRRRSQEASWNGAQADRDKGPSEAAVRVIEALSLFLSEIEGTYTHTHIYDRSAADGSPAA